MKTNLLPLMIFACFAANKSFSQGNQPWVLPGNGNATATSFVGTTNAVPLNLKTVANQPMQFFTNNTQRMTILGGPVGGATTGFVGLGTANPTQKLEVNAGNINVATNTNAYMLGGQNFLWHKGNSRNIYVGVGAGNNAVNNTSYNTYLGNNAGYIGSGANPNSNNTFLGAEAGYNNDADDNVAVGYQAAKGLTGQNTTGLTAIGTYAGLIGSQNGETVFVGYKAGRQTKSSSNCFVGFRSGENNISGGNNSFFGNASGNNNANFNSNTYVGASCGNKSNGDFNTNVGAYSGQLGVGNNNVLLGVSTMKSATSGNENVIIGSNANSATTGNNFNTMVGTKAGLVNSTGAKNTFVGYQTALTQLTGDNNAYLGSNTGNNMTSGNNNTFIGGNADATNVASVLNNATAIGANAKVTNNNHMILGDNVVNVGIGLSADATGPQNKLEINTSAISAIPGASGLRFRDLTSASTTITNPGTGVLSVNSNGDVIYVPSGSTGSSSGITTAQNGVSLLNSSTVEFGNAIGGNSAALLNDREIPMQGHNIVFTGNGKIGIGTTVMGRKLHVAANAAGNDGMYIENTVGNASLTFKNASSTGADIASQINSSITNRPNVLQMQSDGDVEVFAKGNHIFGDLASAGGYVGMYVPSGTSLPNTTRGACHGLFVIESNFNGFPQLQIIRHQTTNAGAYDNIATIGADGNADGKMELYSRNTQASANVFLSAQEGGSSRSWIANGSNVGINTKTPQVTLDVNGSIFASGTISSSDSSLKTNIQTLSINAIDKLKQVRPVSFEWVTKLDTAMNGTQYGFIAQSFEQIFPDLVKTDALGKKSINYTAIIPLLVKANQQQQAKIDSLTKQLNSKDSIQDARLSALENAINQCCSNAAARNNNSNLYQLDIELSDKDAIVLNQNVPNPFAEQTTITYNVPSSVEKAQLIFFNSNGQVIQTVDIKTRGKGKVNVFASDLSSGLYHYTLVADGKVIDSKKMVRE